MKTDYRDILRYNIWGFLSSYCIAEWIRVRESEFLKEVNWSFKSRKFVIVIVQYFFRDWVFFRNILLVIIIIFILQFHWEQGFPWFSLTIHPSLSFIALGRSSRLLPVSAQSWRKSLLVGQPWYVHVKEFIREPRLWVRPCSSSSFQHIFFVLFGL